MANPQDAPHGSLSFAGVLFGPNGRITQKQFWMGAGAVLLVNIALNYIGVFGILVWGLMVYVGFCVYAKRLHDIGKSAWVHAIVWLVVSIIAIGSMVLSWGAVEILAESIGPGTIPTEEDIMEIMPELMSEMVPLSVGYGINLVIWLAYTIWLGIGHSQKFDNRYGRGPAGDTF